MRLLAAGILGLVTVLAAGCGEDPPPGPSAVAGPPSASAAPPRKAFDPPTRFDAAAGLPLGPGRADDVLLYANTAFVGGETGTTATDLLTGRQAPLLAPTNPPLQRPGGLGKPVGHPPALVQRPGQGAAVVVPYPVTVPASGTTAARQAVELVVADAATGQKITVLTVDATPAEGDFTAVAGEYAQVVGSQGNVVVLTVGKQVTVAADLTTGSVLWRKDDVRAAAVLGDTVVGVTAPDGSDKQAIVGLGVTDGARRWSALDVRNADVAPGGPAFVVVLAEQNDGKRFYALVHGDGKVTDQATGQYGAGLRCRYDAAAVTVCAIATSDPLFGLAATTGKVLWQLPATGRVAPAVTAVWHGAVYGTANGKPLVLDAHTGADREPNPGLAPVAVTGYAGVSADPAGQTLLAYPAVG